MRVIIVYGYLKKRTTLPIGPIRHNIFLRDNLKNVICSASEGYARMGGLGLRAYAGKDLKRLALGHR